MRLVWVLITLVLFSIIGVSESFAESESFTVAARNYYDYQIFMNSGDQISFAIVVQGGSDDDIYLTLYSPTGSKLIDGVVYDQFTDNFSAMNSGTYTFRFDNTGSTISNKSVGFSYEVQVNTYYVYVDPLPSWAIYPGSTVYDSTEAWKDANPSLNFYQADSPETANLRIQWVKEFGVEHVGYAYGSNFIEVGLGDSNCTGGWQPFSTDHVNWIMKHEIGHVLGLEHSSDPTSIMYPTAPSAQYGMIEQQFTLSEGYVQFVPFCNSKSIADFSYSVSTDDPTYGFDVYVVPSVKEFDNVIDGNSFRHYSSSECFGEGYLGYSGTCKGISQGSGLLVSLDNRQSNSLTKLTIQQQESSTSSTSLQSITTATISYNYPEVYEEDSHSLEDIFSQLEDEQIKFENEKRTLEDELAKQLSETEDDFAQKLSDADKKIDAISTAYAKKETTRDMIDAFSLQIDDAVGSLTGLSSENQDTQNKIEQAWQEKAMAESELQNAEKQWVLGEEILQKKDGVKAKLYFDNIKNIIQSGKNHLTLTYNQVGEVQHILSTQQEKIICGEGTELIDNQCVPIKAVKADSQPPGSCLIATASYGSELAPQVQMLREIRDNVLLSTDSGVLFMEGFNTIYYSFSPEIAQLENDNPIFKEAVKIFITPMISTLSIMTLVDVGSESQVILFGVSTMGLIVGMYFVAPAIVIWQVKKRF